MNEHMDFLLHRHRFLLAGLFTVGWIVLLSAVITAIGPVHTQAGTTSNTSQAGWMEGSNAVTTTLSDLSDGLDRGTRSLQNGIYDTAHSVTATLARSGHFLTNSGKLITNGVGYGFAAAFQGVHHGLLLTGQTAVRGALSVWLLPARSVSFAARLTDVNAFIHPADHDAVPVIDARAPAVATAQAAFPASPAPAVATPQSDTPAWPIHGMITTEFGVPEPPYEPIHTGLDISDGRPAGVTPIKAFRRGQVIDVEHTGGLGNHVVVDHGNGVTSVYGHMNSIAVTVGQQVDTSTTLGYEGTTGVSTGPHLHFEIRIDGQAVNPHLFISGHP